MLGHFGGIEEEILGHFGGIADVVGASAGAPVPHWRTDLGVTARAEALSSLTPWKGWSEGFDCRFTY